MLWSKTSKTAAQKPGLLLAPLRLGVPPWGSPPCDAAARGSSVPGPRRPAEEGVGALPGWPRFPRGTQGCHLLRPGVEEGDGLDSCAREGGNFPPEVDTGLNINRLWDGAWPGPPERRAGPPPGTAPRDDAGCDPAPAAPRRGPGLPPAPRPPSRQPQAACECPPAAAGTRRVPPPAPAAAGAVAPAPGTGPRGPRVPAKGKGGFGGAGGLTFGKGFIESLRVRAAPRGLFLFNRRQRSRGRGVTKPSSGAVPPARRHAALGPAAEPEPSGAAAFPAGGATARTEA